MPAQPLGRTTGTRGIDWRTAVLALILLLMATWPVTATGDGRPDAVPNEAAPADAPFASVDATGLDPARGKESPATDKGERETEDATRADNDGDGIDDATENSLLNTWAPVVILNPDETAWPCNVNWFLGGATMRFHQDDWCSDDEILPWYTPTQSNIITQTNDKYDYDCDPYGDLERSWYDFDEGGCYFLQINDWDHVGIDPYDYYGDYDPSDWIVYGHVYPNNYSGVNVQYWFFYAYNDNWLTINHEGDFESITVQLDYYHDLISVIYYQHGHPQEVSSPPLYNSTHPVVLSAKGSHASYPSLADCQNHQHTPVIEPGCYWCDAGNYTQCDTAWFTWGGMPAGAYGWNGGGIVNVGERSGYQAGHLNGQSFIHYSGLWGEIGMLDFTTGPSGPAYQGSWNENRGGTDFQPVTLGVPYPEPNASGAPLDQDLTWFSFDPDGGNLTYDVQLDTSNPPMSTVSWDQEERTYDAWLNYETTYYWQIIIHDDEDNTVTGPVWSFTSESEPNDPPVANAGGPYSGEPGESILFDASASYDFDGDVVEYRWDFEDDDHWDTGWLTSPTVYHSYPSPWLYTVIVEVKDDDGATDTDWQHVSIEENLPPVADAGGPYSGNVGQSITVDGSGSYDSDGTVTAYRWDWNNDGTYETNWSSSPTASHAFGSAGDHSIRLQVRDDDLEPAIDTATVSINHPPVADAGGPYASTVNVPLYVSGFGSSDPDGTVTEYRWDWNNDGSYDTGWSSSHSAYHTYSTPGTHTLKLQVRDDDLATDTDTATALINALPVADAGGPYTGNVDEDITFDASASYDPDGSITGYRWDWHNNGYWDTGWLTSPTVTHDYSSPGTKTVRVQVRDSSDATAIDTATVIVNHPPIANAGSSYIGLAGEPITVDASASTDQDGTITGYRWDWDNDGTYDTNWLSTPIATHTWSSLGSYTIRLEVRDNQDARDTDTAAVFITEPGANLVQNLDTGENFDFIQAAIDDSDTLAGHTLLAHTGLYLEGTIIIHKAITLQGEDRNGTVIEALGDNINAIEITADGATVEKLTIRSQAGGYTLWAGIHLSADNSIIRYTTLQNGFYGITGDSGVSGGEIRYNWIGGFSEGFHIWQSADDFTISSNTFINNSSAVYLGEYSDSNVISYNQMQGSYIGVQLYRASDNNVYRNYIYNDGSGYAIKLFNYASNNTIANNTLATADVGIRIELWSNANTIRYNTIRSNDNYGAYLAYDSDNNLFHHNDFKLNGINAYEYDDGTSTLWDNGSSGNYWDDYTSNPGYPATYEIYNCGGADHHPLVHSGGGGCFLAGTRITMADGTSKPIEKIMAGEEVIAGDGISGKQARCKVLQVHHHDGVEMADFHLVINGVLRVTPNHVLFVNGKWIDAGQVREGHMLTRLDGTSAPVTSVERVAQKSAVFNLTVKELNTYYAEGFLVHNRKSDVQQAGNGGGIEP